MLLTRFTRKYLKNRSFHEELAIICILNFTNSFGIFNKNVCISIEAHSRDSSKNMKNLANNKNSKSFYPRNIGPLVEKIHGKRCNL
jgi:hypothetical protein